MSLEKRAKTALDRAQAPAAVRVSRARALTATRGATRRTSCAASTRWPRRTAGLRIAPSRADPSSLLEWAWSASPSADIALAPEGACPGGAPYATIGHPHVSASRHVTPPVE